MGTSASALTEAYDAYLGGLYDRKAVLSEKATLTCKSQASFAETYRTVFAFIANARDLRHLPNPTSTTLLPVFTARFSEAGAIEPPKLL